MVGSYKQVKHRLGFGDYQVRSDRAIRRHWQLVCCAFSFCWWALAEVGAEALELGAPPRVGVENGEELRAAPETGARGKKEWNSSSDDVVAGGAEGGEGVAGAICNASELLEHVLQEPPTTKAKSAA